MTLRRTLVSATALTILAAACGPAAVGPPPSSLATEPAVQRACPQQEPDAAPATPTRAVVAAHPDEPAAFHPAFHGDAASQDLAALWGLPLFSYDEAGQLRPGLVQAATVERPGQVRLALCPGQWSDGTPVTAADVVATVEALVTSPSPWLVEGLTATADGADVLVRFATPTGRWQHALADLGPVLPAAVLAADGLEAFRDGVPVSGGPFQLDAVEPGLSRTFTANAGSPLGGARLASLEVLVVPRFELALGLLAEGEVDIALGHLSLEPGPRIELVEDGDGRAPSYAVARGNTVLSWQWLPDGPNGVGTRREVQDGLDLTVFAQGLLTGEGEVARSFTPGVAGPPIPAPRALPDALGEIVLSAPRWHDLPALVARGARDSLEKRGATVRTASDEADVLARAPLGDATIRIRHLGSWPSLRGLLSGAGPDEVIAAADLAATATGPEAQAGAVALWDAAVEVPLVEVGVPHAWFDLDGVRPSAWPGIGFASAGEWS